MYLLSLNGPRSRLTTKINEKEKGKKNRRKIQKYERRRRNDKYSRLLSVRRTQRDTYTCTHIYTFTHSKLTYVTDTQLYVAGSTRESIFGTTRRWLVSDENEVLSLVYYFVHLTKYRFFLPSNVLWKVRSFSITLRVLRLDYFDHILVSYTIIYLYHFILYTQQHTCTFRIILFVSLKVYSGIEKQRKKGKDLFILTFNLILSSDSFASHYFELSY